MYVKKNLMLWAAALVLALPLMFTASAGAGVTALPGTFNTDGAIHDATSGQWVLPSSFYCIATPSGFTPTTGDLTGHDAVRRDDLATTCDPTKSFCTTCTISSTTVKNAIKYSDYPTNTVLRTITDCVAHGYAWSGYSGACGASAWTTDDPDSSPLPYYTDHKGCVRCHNKDYINSGTHAGDNWAIKDTYLNGGHKNMSRPIDGKKWGMPGVTDSSLFTGDASHAALSLDGSFSALWTQEDYPTLPINWATGKVTGGYCGTALGVTGSGDVPDLTACPTCESPVMGNGGAGYPLNYPTQAICEAAKKPSTGLPGYVWTPSADYQLYWIYGGAGLEGGPSMMEPGTQQYKCGRCHTTGWSGNNLTDAAVATASKHPWSDGLPIGTNVIGGATKVTKTSTSTSYDYSSWDQWGIECSRCHIATKGEPSTGKDGPNSSGHPQFPAATTKGGDIVALCMNCHRQESDTKPRGNSGTFVTLAAPTVTNAADANMIPFTNKQQQPDGFAHHPDGNEFLNSPHAKFTGKFKDIGCPPYAINGYASYTTALGIGQSEALNILTPGAPDATACTPGQMNLDGLTTTSLYASKFAQASKLILEPRTGAPAAVTTAPVSDSVAGSCSVCHDVHQPLNNNVAGMSKSLKTECIECHSSANAAMTALTPQVDLAIINHPAGAGTPLAEGNDACTVCHQPAGVKHVWRISTDANYRMFGDYTHVDPPSGNPVTANLKDDGTGYMALYVDIDNACGQCHGGGVSQSNATTTTTAAIAGKTYSVIVADVTGIESGKEIVIAGAGVAGADFKTIIASVDAVTKTVYLTYATPAVASAASGAAVTVAGNPTHNGAMYKTRAQLAAQAANMHSVSAPPVPVTCTEAVNTAPVAAHGAVTVSGYTVSFADASTDAEGIAAGGITVNWGDGTTSNGNALSTFAHTYASMTKTYTIKHSVTDAGVASVCKVGTTVGALASAEVFKQAITLQKFAVTVNVLGGATNATVTLKVNGKHTKAVQTGITGSAVFNVPAGTYSVSAWANGYNVTNGSTFAVAGATSQNVTLVAK